MTKVLLTGSGGFIGQRFLSFNKELYNIETASVRYDNVSDLEISPNTNTVVHMSGLAHQLDVNDPVKYDQANFETTKKLVALSIKNNVEHFIFLSTIKVYGEDQNTVLKIDTPCHPKNDPYGSSKLKAEKYLKSIDAQIMKVCIIRPPLVYGPGVKANMLKLIGLCSGKMPIPLGGIGNRRTMVFLDNLIMMINKCIDIQAEGVFNAGDKEAVSTSQLVGLIIKSLGSNTRLIDSPGFMRKIISRLKPGTSKRLFGDLEMETKDSFERLNFVPQYTTEEGVDKMIDWYKQTKIEA